MQLQSRYTTTVIAGGRNLGAFATFAGGEVQSDTVPDRSPGVEYPEAAGGEKTISDVTVTRRIKLGRDTPELRRYLRGLVGVTNAMVVAQRENDANGNPLATGDTYTGTLSTMTPAESDLNSTGEPSILSLTIAPSNVT